MAINDLIGKVFSSQYIAGVKQVTPLLSVANDRSAELQRNGDGLEIPITQGLVSVADYPATADIAYSQLSPTKATFAIDKKKYIAFEVEDTDRAQLAFDLFSEGARQAGEEFGGQLSADIRATLGAQTIVTGNRFAQAIPSTGDTATLREELNLLMINVKQRMLTLGYAARPAIIMHPSTWKRLMRYVTVDKGLTLPQVAQTAFVDGTLTALYGMDIIVDWGATVNTSDENDDALSYVVIRGRTLAYAGQVSQVEQMRSDGRFASRWRALNTYGTLVQETRSLGKIAQTVS